MQRVRYIIEDGEVSKQVRTSELRWEEEYTSKFVLGERMLIEEVIKRVEDRRKSDNKQLRIAALKEELKRLENEK